MARWWGNDGAEIYWLETTDRTDLGIDLKAPQTDDRGLAHAAYGLIREVQPGDVVFHYHTRERQIAYWSKVASDPFAEEIVWASHGTVAREAGVQPYRRPGWRALLEGPFPVDPPLSLADLREAEPQIRDVFSAIRSDENGSLYSPFAISDKRSLRPTQFYLTKMPRAIVLALSPLAAAVENAAVRAGRARDRPTAASDVADSVDELGDAYIPADELAATSEREPFSVDPTLVDRGLRGHAATQNALAAIVTSLGWQPRRPSPREPQYDLAWRAGKVVYVAEVKSLTPDNEERQLRLGLGQVLRYANLIRQAGTVCVPVLAVEREPSDRSWNDLCDHVGVRLGWSPAFHTVLDTRLAT
jgi:hypothetical protein